jgi:DNA-binding transcriptional LysR family regulator
LDTSEIDLDLLVALDVLLAERNVTRAAARLRLSQPALSARLARLRALFKDPLFVPAARGVTPTAKALELEAPLRAALQQVRGVVAAGRGFDPRKDPFTLHVVASDYTQTAVLIDFTLAVRRRAPHARIALRALGAANLEAQMELGAVDLALINAVDVPPALHARPLFHETYVAITRRAHPIAGRELTPQLFTRLEHIIVSPRGGGFLTPVDAALEAAGLHRTTVVSTSSFLFVLEMVARSDLVALVPRRLVPRRGHQLRIHEPPIPIDGFSIVMAWHSRAHHDPGQKWIRQQLLEHVTGWGNSRARAGSVDLA